LVVVSAAFGVSPELAAEQDAIPPRTGTIAIARIAVDRTRFVFKTSPLCDPSSLQRTRPLEAGRAIPDRACVIRVAGKL
jgi:hypothetical protein